MNSTSCSSFKPEVVGRQPAKIIGGSILHLDLHAFL